VGVAFETGLFEVLSGSVASGAGGVAMDVVGGRKLNRRRARTTGEAGRGESGR
jgi:hypothetical protein